MEKIKTRSRKKDKTPSQESHLRSLGDEAVVCCMNGLIADFRSVFGNECCKTVMPDSLNNWRDFDYNIGDNDSPYYVKFCLQLRDFCKRYTFDKENQREFIHARKERTIEKRFQTEYRLAAHWMGEPTYRAKLVLKEARRIAKAILGELDHDKLVSNAKFGKKSSAGCPFNLAYIDHKLTVRQAFTCTSSVESWFERHIYNQDANLKRILRKLGTPGFAPTLVESLEIKTVPKSWKVERPITPLALLTLFYSYGLGSCFEEALKMAGLSISIAQSKHRRWAERFSKTGTHITIDLSDASSSIVSQLCNYILPRPWYVSLKKVFSRKNFYVDPNGNQREWLTMGVLPMGNAATFPVETLLFYCITKAVGNLMGKGGIYSVYGDDIICPKNIYPQLRLILSELGLKVNAEKTFVTSPFRESCGADYFRGVAVRPALAPERKGTYRDVHNTSYLSFLYSLYDSLIQRWEEDEIPCTLNGLARLIAEACSGHVHRVPMSYPGSTGIRTLHPYTIPFGFLADELRPIRYGFYPVRKGFRRRTSRNFWYTPITTGYKFVCLRNISAKRRVVDTAPYYLLSLMGQDDAVEESLDKHQLSFVKAQTSSVEDAISALYSDGEPQLSVTIKRQKREITVGPPGRQRKKVIEHVQRKYFCSSKTESRYERVSNQLTEWYR